jgi:sugar-phosphatase
VTWPVRAGALLIDLDGTLVDSRGPIARAWDRWAGRRGVDPALIWPIMPGRTADAVMRQVRPDLPDPVLASDQAKLLEWQVADTDGVTALPGAAGLLAALPAGQWAVVTSGSGPLARARLRAAGLPVPSVLIGCDSVTASKPDPSGYLAAAGRLGVPPARCLVVEDAAAGIAAGHAAGMRVLAVPPAAPDPPALQVPGLDWLRVEGRDRDGSLILASAGAPGTPGTV